MAPSSASSGVRIAPLPVVPGWERPKVRVTLLSCLEGTPYALNPAPGAFIHGGTSGGSAAASSSVPRPVRPVAASTATVRFRNPRLDTPIRVLLGGRLRSTGSSLRDQPATTASAPATRVSGGVEEVAADVYACPP